MGVPACTLGAILIGWAARCLGCVLVCWVDGHERAHARCSAHSHQEDLSAHSHQEDLSAHSHQEDLSAHSHQDDRATRRIYLHTAIRRIYLHIAIRTIVAAPITLCYHLVPLSPCACLQGDRARAPISLFITLTVHHSVHHRIPHALATLRGPLPSTCTSAHAEPECMSMHTDAPPPRCMHARAAPP